jgi:ATP-dependent Clp protease ATP-binding subunit ClpC
MSKKSLRVYFVVYDDGRRMGRLMRTWDKFFDRPAPSAYGVTDADVYDELETQLERLRVQDPQDIERYLWEERFETLTVPVEVHPQSSIERLPVIGKKKIPLVLSYAYAALEGGGFRVMLPRFGAWFILEELSLAQDAIRHVVSTWLLGENARWVYDLRQVGDEYVAEWSPPVLARARAEAERAATQREEVPPELAKVADLLTERAARGKLAPVVGEVPAFAELAAWATLEKPPSVLLVGPSGVGKSALVRRLAMFYASTKPPAGGRRRRLYSTSEARIVAGMVYLGMWQERCLKLVRELADDPDVLHVDSLAGLLSPQPDGASIADFFEPAMEGGELHLLTECTDEELERARRLRPGFLARFRVLRIAEPGHPDLIALIAAYAQRRHALAGPAATWKRVVRHAAALDRGVAFPGKALRFIDWLGQQRAGTKATVRTAYPRDISEAYSRYSGVPVQLLSDDVSASAEQLADGLKARVIGQDAACDVCGRVLARFKANLTDPDRPAGTLLFVGPTGVGKTELAKQLARTTFGGEDRIVRLDMSEYMLPGSSQRMLDARPGQTSLAVRIRQRPLSLVLLDEIEKAHPEVFDLLLGVLGEGRMTDDSGRFVDFRTALIVMTSNVGVTDSLPAGFGSAARDDFIRPVRAFFRPEFVARVDHVLSFRALAPADVERIVDLEIDAAARRPGFARRSLRLAATPRARQRLAERGYHPTRGARPLRRLIEERVIAPIAAAIAADPSLSGTQVVVAREGEAVPAGARAFRIE